MEEEKEETHTKEKNNLIECHTHQTKPSEWKKEMNKSREKEWRRKKKTVT